MTILIGNNLTAALIPSPFWKLPWPLTTRASGRRCRGPRSPESPVASPPPN
jgi:hypothetical protein